MTLLLLASAAFLLTHLGISSSPIRAALVAGIGNAYLALYSILAAVTLGFMIYAYIDLPHTEFLWAPSKLTYAIAKILMPFAFVFLVCGLMAPNPTAVRQDENVNKPLAGILKITRHPVQWGILLWAISHLVANGDVASLIFFGTFAALSSIGMAAMDAKHRAREGEAWKAFFSSTSYLPFGAILSGKISFSIKDLNAIGVAAGVAIYVMIYLTHGWLIGIPIV